MHPTLELISVTWMDRELFNRGWMHPTLELISVTWMDRELFNRGWMHPTLELISVTLTVQRITLLITEGILLMLELLESISNSGTFDTSMQLHRDWMHPTLE
jgi:hypothetical protein